MMAVALAHSCVMLCTLESTRHELGTTRIWRRMAYLKVHISLILFFTFFEMRNLLESQNRVEIAKKI